MDFSALGAEGGNAGSGARGETAKGFTRQRAEERRFLCSMRRGWLVRASRVHCALFCAAARGLGERQGDAVPLRPSGRNLRFLHLPPGASAPCGGVGSSALRANIARLFVRCGARGGETSGGRRPPKTLWQEPEVPAPPGFLPLLFPYFVTSMPRARSASGIVTPSFAATSGL